MVISGVIRPPPDIRAVANKTALFVAKNGRTFETRILNSAKGQTPKFAFLHDNSPFHAYYEERIRFYQEGGTDEEEKKEEEAAKKKRGAEEEEKKKIENDQEEASSSLIKEPVVVATTKVQSSTTASALDPVARALLAQRSKIRSAREAQEKAAAAAKEKQDAESNSQMSSAEQQPQQQQQQTNSSLLVPPPDLHHIHVAAPSNLTPAQVDTIKLVAQFVALQGKGSTLLKELTTREWNNPIFGFLQTRHVHFAYFSALVDEYQHVISQTLEQHNKKDGIIKECANNVNKCLELASYRAEYSKDLQDRSGALGDQDDGGGGVLGGASKIDWHDFVVVETIDFDMDEVLVAVPPPPLPEAVLPQQQQEEEEETYQGGDEEVIRVSQTYQPKVVSTQHMVAERDQVIDPITGQKVSIKDTSEHMRIQLLDPKWAEEKKKFQEKQKESNLLSGEAIASNISRLAQARSDLFSTEADSLQGDAKARLEEANRVIRESQGPAGPSFRPSPDQNRPLVAAHLQQQQPPPPPPPSGMAQHDRPELSLPDPKRPRVMQDGSVISAPPTTYTQPPPPPLPPSAAVAGATVAAPASEATTTAAAPPVFDPAAATMAKPDAAANQQGEAAAATTTTATTEQPQQPSVLSEEAFAEQTPKVKLSIVVPNDPNNAAWEFRGQTLSMEDIDVMSSIKSIKGQLQPLLGGMPSNKMQLKVPGGAFLKDSHSLARLNIGPTASLELIPKTRGGRK